METVKGIAWLSMDDDAPIISEKFGVYVCTYVSADRMMKDIRTAKRLRPGALRYDPGWGFGNDTLHNSPRELDSPQITEEDGQIIIRWRGMEHLMQGLQESRIAPFCVHAYNPIPLQAADAAIQNANPTLDMRSAWNTMPADLDAWAWINEQYARRWSTLGFSALRYELWNEPDLQPVFFTGSVQEYCLIYQYGAAGVKRGDMSARVGGPAISSSRDWAKTFLDFVSQNDMPLDFFSYHVYGSPEHMVEDMRALLGKYPWMRTKEVLITEYNVFVPATPDFTQFGSIEGMRCASLLLHTFRYYLAQHDIHQVFWAQLQDPEVYGQGVDRCGLLSLDGLPKPAFFAWELFARMPSRRRKLTLDDASLEGMAAADEHTASILLWNLSDQEKNFALALSGVPFKVRRSEVAALREGTAGGVLCALETEHGASMPEVWCGRIRPYGVVQLFCQDHEDVSRVDPFQVMRMDRYTHQPWTTMYAEYDRRAQVVYLGAGERPEGMACIAITPAGEQGSIALRVEEDSLGDEACLAIYADRAGERTCYFWGGQPSADLPWDTAPASARMIPCQSPSVSIAAFDRISFLLADAPAGGRARIFLLPVNA